MRPARVAEVEVPGDAGSRGGRPAAALAACLLAVAAVAAPPPLVEAGRIGDGWRFTGLPGQTLPRTRFDAVELDGRPVLRIASDASYGNLVHRLQGSEPALLGWRWRLDLALRRADLRTREADDSALKVCVSYDLPLDRVPFVERQLLRIARARSPEPLPAATVCYVWDPSLPAGTLLPNVYTKRMRWIVLRGAGDATGGWAEEQRDLQADFLRAFGDETRQVPPVSALIVGADADNTGGRALGFVDALQWLPE